MWIYNLGLVLYVWAIALASPWHRKAKLWIDGRKGLFRRMKESIDPSARIIWIHAASLGEFEQGRPLIEKIRKEHPEYKILLTFFSPSGYEIRKITIRPTTSSTCRSTRRAKPAVFWTSPTPKSSSSSNTNSGSTCSPSCAAARSAATSYRPSSAATRSSSAPTEAIGAWHSKVSTRSSFRTTTPKITGRTGLRQRRSRR